MDILTEQHREDIKKKSTSRLKSKLLTTGFTDKEVESFDRQTCLEWAELAARGIDLPLPTTPQSPQTVTYDAELERERLICTILMWCCVMNLVIVVKLSMQLLIVAVRCV